MNTEIPSNTFHAMLQHQRKGKLLAELSAKLQEVTLAAREHGEPASLVLTIRAAPANGDAAVGRVVKMFGEVLQGQHLIPYDIAAAASVARSLTRSCLKKTRIEPQMNADEHRSIKPRAL